MASIDRYRPPAREGYLPPSRQQQPQPQQQQQQQPPPPSSNGARPSRSPSRRPRDVPPAVPTPPPSHAPYRERNESVRPQSRHSGAQPDSAQTSNARPPVPMANQWLFTRDEVVSCPSILDGMSPVEERLRRAKGVNFIYQAGILLELPQTTLYVAGVFFHRFYMRYSMDERLGIHHYNIAATALFLANKTEENCTKTKNIIIAVAKVAQKNAKLIIDEQSKEYWRWRDSILMYEEVMLEALTFDLIVHHPYSQLYKMLERIAGIHNKRLRHAAWAFCNDACLTAMPLIMESRDIAIASLFFSSNFTGERIEDVDGMPWYEALEGNTDRIIQAISILHEFYKENPLRKQDNPYQGSPEFSLEATRKNGEGSSTNATPRTDHNMLSPGPKANGTNEGTNDITMKDRDAVEAAAVEEASQTAPGDSDAVLKEAANIPATHTSTQNTNSENGDGLLSPASKRKTHESLPAEIQDQKRPRTGSDADEGEVRE